MNGWLEIIGLVVSSSALTTLVSSFVNRKTEKQTREFNYAEKLEARIEKLEKRLDKFEMRDNIYTSATACANSCNVSSEKCPVIAYLESHPVPEKE